MEDVSFNFCSMSYYRINSLSEFILNFWVRWMKYADTFSCTLPVEAQLTELSLLQQSLGELERTHLKIKQNVSKPLLFAPFKFSEGD